MSGSTSSSSSDDDLFRNLDLSWVDEQRAGPNAAAAEEIRERALRNSASESVGLEEDEIEDPYSREQQVDCQDEEFEEEEDEERSENSAAQEKEKSGIIFGMDDHVFRQQGTRTLNPYTRKYAIHNIT
ncbi:hypothetical protein [Pseudoalteromonas sp.]|uniref:hypothetical protein n=1 Tax=Pseudoalteromonas sp. TaxID=53249 RepID=UPI00261B417B|nr:hypothetical protein [Pseudoalteromonas sp.]MCP4585577.1 hypothetical protein [Pseudoalteromonas sp.]